MFSLQLKPQNQTKQKSKNYILKVHPVSSLATRISVVHFRACQQKVLRFTINAYVSILAKHVGLDCLQARIYQVQLPRCVYLTLWMDNIMNIVRKILAVINATYAAAKRKPEKIRLAGIRTLTSAIPVQRSNQLS